MFLLACFGGKYLFTSMIHGKLKTTFYFLFLIVAALSSVFVLSIVFPEFGQAVMDSKANYDYFMLMLDLKLESIDRSTSSELFLGGAMGTATARGIGGDFVIFDAAVKVGLVLLAPLFMYLFVIANRRDRVLLLAGLLSSFHYGTLFVLTGQLIFGALVTQSIDLTRHRWVALRKPGPSLPLMMESARLGDAERSIVGSSGGDQGFAPRTG